MAALGIAILIPLENDNSGRIYICIYLQAIPEAVQHTQLASRCGYKSFHYTSVVASKASPPPGNPAFAHPKRPSDLTAKGLDKMIPSFLAGLGFSLYPRQASLFFSSALGHNNPTNHSIQEKATYVLMCTFYFPLRFLIHPNQTTTMGSIARIPLVYCITFHVFALPSIPSF